MAVTSYGRNKNHDDKIKKNQEKANNSLSYRCAAIKHRKERKCQKTTNEIDRHTKPRKDNKFWKGTNIILNENQRNRKLQMQSPKN